MAQRGPISYLLMLDNSHSHARNSTQKCIVNIYCETSNLENGCFSAISFVWTIYCWKGFWVKIYRLKTAKFKERILSVWSWSSITKKVSHFKGSNDAWPLQEKRKNMAESQCWLNEMCPSFFCQNRQISCFYLPFSWLFIQRTVVCSGPGMGRWLWILLYL